MARPGKYEASGDIGEALHEISLNGFSQCETGDAVMGSGHYSLLIGTGVPGAEFAILREDNSGFIDYEAFDSEDEALAAWDAVLEEAEEEEKEE